MDARRDAVVVEPHDVVGDLLEVVLDREVAGVETDELGVGEVAEVRLAAFGREEDVALPPEDEGVRLAPAERRLPRRVQSSVRSVVVEQVELHAVRVRASQEVEIGGPVVGADPAQIPMAGRVDGLHGVGLKEGHERRFRFRRPVDPKRVPDAVPSRGEAFLVRVGVLDDLPLQPLGVVGDDPVADRPAVVLHVNAHRTGELDSDEEVVDNAGEVVERVRPCGGVWHVRIAEARVVRRHHVEAFR